MPQYVPDFVFTEVDVEETAAPSDDEKKEDEADNEEEFAFNLFSSAPTDSTSDKTSKPATVVISKEEEKVDLFGNGIGNYEVPLVNKERPDSYYFSSPTDEQKEQFKTAAVSHTDIFNIASLYTPNNNPRKVIDYTALADKIRQEKVRDKKRRRAGKNTRERAKKRNEALKEQQKQQFKARSFNRPFNKRGGFKK